jgi:hypothetical protein
LRATDHAKQTRTSTRPRLAGGVAVAALAAEPERGQLHGVDGNRYTDAGRNLATETKDVSAAVERRERSTRNAFDKGNKSGGSRRRPIASLNTGHVVDRRGDDLLQSLNDILSQIEGQGFEQHRRAGRTVSRHGFSNLARVRR